MVLLQERREKEESKNAPPCALSTTGRIVDGSFGLACNPAEIPTDFQAP